MAKKLSAGIVPAYRDTRAHEWRYLLLRAYNYWDFPKGVVEFHEEPLEAALRELREETSLSGALILAEGAYYETEPYSSGKIARYYLGQVSALTVKLVPNAASGILEHHEYRWVTAQNAAKLLVPRVRSALEWAAKILETQSTAQK